MPHLRVEPSLKDRGISLLSWYYGPFAGCGIVKFARLYWVVGNTEKHLVILLMGVSGAGKTTIGQLLASELGWEFVDADDYHSRQNVEKMRTGIPLTDDDRSPWLKTLRALIEDRIAKKQNMILACSALKQAYRRTLQVTPAVQILFLKGMAETLRQRLSNRRGHYMTEGMLASQLEALEAPEDALVIDVEGSPLEIVAEIRAGLTL